MFILIATALLALAAYLAWRAWQRRRDRQALLQTRLHPQEWEMITRAVPLVQRLPAQLRPALEGKINVFLHQVEFQGCDGLEVTDEMTLSIAAQACLLVVNTQAWYDTLTTVMIYPAAFKSLWRSHDGMVVTEEVVVRFGESWTRGPVILSWADTQRGALNTEDGHNVAIHEFAHQLDGLSGHTDGAPLMQQDQSLAEWETVVLAAFDRHVARVETGKPTVMDAYGAQNHQEFFAVAVETFYEKPAALQQDEPALYAQLVALFQVDPATWDA